MAQIAKVRCIFWHEHKIYKFINRTFAKESLLWYNLSIKGGFPMKNTLFEHFGGTYTKRVAYWLADYKSTLKSLTSHYFLKQLLSWGCLFLFFFNTSVQTLYGTDICRLNVTRFLFFDNSLLAFVFT